MTSIHSTNSLKSIHETLCRVQQLVLLNSHSYDYKVTDSEILQNLINNIDQQRPLGSNGKHGDLHTSTCGCEDR